MLVDKGNKLGDGSSAWVGTNPKGALFFSLPKTQVTNKYISLCFSLPKPKLQICIRVFLLGFLINAFFFLGIFVRFFLLHYL
jgi:hypothetical protein